MDGSSREYLTLEHIDELLEQPYWVVDILPVQVPVNSPGQYFAVQDYYLKKPRIAALHRKFAEILLKLNCYFDLSLGAVSGDAWLREEETKAEDPAGLGGQETKAEDLAGFGGQETKAEDPGGFGEQEDNAGEASDAQGAGILWVRNPDPEELAGALCNEADIWTIYVYFPAEDALIYINCDDTYLTVYHPAEHLLGLLRKLAGAEGLFIWQPEKVGE